MAKRDLPSRQAQLLAISRWLVAYGNRRHSEAAMEVTALSNAGRLKWFRNLRTLGAIAYYPESASGAAGWYAVRNISASPATVNINDDDLPYDAVLQHDEQRASLNCGCLLFRHDGDPAIKFCYLHSLPRTCDCATSGNVHKLKQHGADLHAKNCIIYRQHEHGFVLADVLAFILLTGLIIAVVVGWLS